MGSMDLPVLIEGFQFAIRFHTKMVTSPLSTTTDTILSRSKPHSVQRHLLGQIAEFSPSVSHTDIRVQEQFSEFCRCFNRASQLYITPIYRAGEKPIEGITHENLAQGIRDHGHRAVYTAPSLEGIKKQVLEHAKPGDVIITLGAGNVNSLCTSSSGRIEMNTNEILCRNDESFAAHTPLRVGGMHTNGYGSIQNKTYNP